MPMSVSLATGMDVASVIILCVSPARIDIVEDVKGRGRSSVDTNQSVSALPTVAITIPEAFGMLLI